MTAPTIADVLIIAERVARSVSQWSGLDADDLAGDLIEIVARRADDYVTLLAEGRADTAAGWLRGEAGRIAQRERVRLQREQGQYVYDPEYVRAFLPFLFARQDWARGPAPEENRDSWRTGEAVDTAIDACAAWARLKAWHHAVILARHVGCRPSGTAPDWEAIAGATGRASGHAAEQAYSAATAALAVEMNAHRAARAYDYDGPGSRHAMSNAAARYRMGE